MSKFLAYIHNLRGIAILFVVGVHARGNSLDWVSHQDTQKFMASILDAKEGNGTVMFLFIAGFLFQHITQYKFDFTKYINQKFKVIILPYLIISIPIIIFRIMTHYQPFELSPGFTNKPAAYQFIYHLVIGTHMSPFWFITAIILFYVTSPVLHWLDQPNFYRYAFPFILLVGLFTYRPEHNLNPVLAYFHYLPVYFTGMWASRFKDRVFTMNILPLYILGAVYVVLTYFDLKDAFTLPASLSFEKVINERLVVFNIYMLRTLILCFAVALLFYRLQFVKMPLLETLAEYSFGIYFFHFILMIAARKILSLLYISVDFTFISFTIFLLFIILCSTVTVFLIKKLTGPYSRNLIGS